MELTQKTTYMLRLTKYELDCLKSILANTYASQLMDAGATEGRAVELHQFAQKVSKEWNNRKEN